MQDACLAIYPNHALAADIDPDLTPHQGFSRIILPHNIRQKHEFDEVLPNEEQAVGTIIKPAQIVSWRGDRGYFRDPAGHLSEVAWSESWNFNSNGSLVIE